jgi:Carboxypeptidase regulatory-like domain
MHHMHFLGGLMANPCRGLLVALVVLTLPAAALAQSSIAGAVKDASGAVLPGVTVEASSAALIEKARTAVTDGAGQYRIVDLPPGTYDVVFSLSGFKMIRREGIVLQGTFTAQVNADLQVGHSKRPSPCPGHRRPSTW